MLDLYDDFDDNFILFGIQSSILDEVKFTYLLNQVFEWRLQRIDDLDVTFNNDEIYCYSSYLYTHPINQDDYVYLIKNKSHEKEENNNNQFSLFQNVKTSSSRPLLEKYKMYHFLIKLPEEIDPEIINKLKNVSVDFILNIQQIEQISKKEEKYFLI